MTRKYDAARHRYANFDLEHLHCYACAHSDAHAVWPGRPSGDRPCHFCVRNPLHVQNLSDDHEWFDGTAPISVPMDCYCSSDMRVQYGEWLEEANDAGQTALRKLLDLHERLGDD
jgi:hypothetical protein